MKERLNVGESSKINDLLLDVAILKKYKISTYTQHKRRFSFIFFYQIVRECPFSEKTWKIWNSRRYLL